MSGREHWRSLDQLNDTEEFRRFLEAEFPSAVVPEDLPSRREFMRLMGASFALAGLAGCVKQPEEKILPFVRQPEDVVPGRPLHYATVLDHDGFANGVVVTTHMGRPTKVEGNSLHAQSAGATTTFAQADILELYDPDRSRAVLRRGRSSTWSKLVTELQARVEQLKARGAGQALRILLPAVTSPTLAGLLFELEKHLPGARWHQWSPMTRGAVYEGAKTSFGRPLETHYDLSQAEVVLAVEADFMQTMPGGLKNARALAMRRQNGGAKTRLYSVESSPLINSFLADHRVRLKPSAVGGFLADVARKLGVKAIGAGAKGMEDLVEAVAEDLRAASGRSAVIVGPTQPAPVHDLAHRINAQLGNTGRTVFHSRAVPARVENEIASIESLGRDIKEGRVEALIAFGNPLYDAPADLGLKESFDKVPFRVHVGRRVDETGTFCHWHVPESHPFEAWGDLRAIDGAASVVQPLIAPLYATKSKIEVIAALLGQSTRSGKDLVESHWKSERPGPGFEAFWRRGLHDGVLPNTAFPVEDVTPIPGGALPVTGEDGSIDLAFRPDPSTYDGRYANNAWLQELPKPHSKVTWDNTAQISPKLADELGVTDGDLLQVEQEGRKLTVPVFVSPGQAEECVTVFFGYGRTRAGDVGNNVGYDAYKLRTTLYPWYFPGAKLTKTRGHHTLASTQDHHSMQGRHLVRSATRDEHAKSPNFAKAPDAHVKKLTLYQHTLPKLDGEHQWAMSVDLNTCIGCNACTIACQAENNIPVVGKSEVLNGRELHWIRIDRYYEGDVNDPGMYAQPVMCMHCENAPCELVCPVNATVHGPEGLNQMVYNRCVGTRYCSNNCPYKVRRFNFRLYADFETESLKAQRNPNVSVRSRGVMEKCTYCIQRISAARIEARKEHRKVRDGEIVTACEAVCPTQAIVFGDMSDPKSRVSQARQSELSYTLLDEVNAKPRTTYLARVSNPNPSAETASPGEKSGVDHGE